MQPHQRSFSQHRFTLAIFSVRGLTGHAPRRSFGAPQNRPFPPLNLHKARVRRNHGRPPPNGFTGRARSSSPTFTPQRKRASGKALAFPDTFQKPNKRKLLQVASSGLEPVRLHRLVDRAHLLH